MREILFRGKRIDNGEWVYGYLYIHNGYSGTSALIRGDKILDTEVDIKTIGEYTGLTDKNGKKIFEGDIVHYYDFAITWGFEVTGNVVYTHDCEFAIEYDDKYIKDQKTTRPLVCAEHPTFTSKKIEVIGNIFDKEVEDVNITN